MNPAAREKSSLPDAFFRTLVERADISLLATDHEFRVTYLNPTAQELLRDTQQEWLGRSLAEIAPLPRQRLFARVLQRTLDRGEPTHFDISLTSPAGKKCDLAVHLTPLPGSDGPAEGLAVHVIDQTHRNELADQLAQAEKMASLGTLASGVAHHFNNILGGVATFVDFALTGGDSAAMRRALQMTAEAAARASKITQSLLSFAARDMHRSDLADLTEVVLTFVHLVERPLEERGIRVRLDVQPAPIVPVEANRMHQVLGNLLTNAEEAMPDGGIIRLSVRRQGEQILLSFADTGCGIEPRHLGLVFEPFFTTKGLLAGGDKGNPGLGLSVVHGLITEMGGTITVASEPGKSTRFDILLPVTRPATSPPGQG